MVYNVTVCDSGSVPASEHHNDIVVIPNTLIDVHLYSNIHCLKANCTHNV